MKSSKSRITHRAKVCQLRRLPLMVTVALLLFWPVRGRVHAAAGDLDPSFGVGGKVTTHFPNNPFADFAADMVIQPDGKIILAGSTFPNVLMFALARYNSDGSLDPTFGSGGRVTTEFSGSAFATSLAFQSDGKIVVAGAVSTGQTRDFALARYNSDGSLDASFGSGGKITTDFFGFDDRASDIAIQSDGKTVVSGLANLSAALPVQVDFALARYDTNGALDSTFGSGGKVITDFFGFADLAEAITIQPGGKIVAAGVAETAPRFGTVTVPGRFAIARYNADGSLDTAFGGSGKITTDVGGISSIADIAIQADGRIVTAGGLDSGLIHDFALARYNGDGSLDPSFGSGGIVTTDIRGSQDFASAVALQSDGKIIAVGASGVGGPFDFTLVRYNTDGSLDSTFGAGGKIITDFFGSSDLAQAVAIQRDGKILAAGSAGNDFALARYLGPTFNLCLQDDSNGNLLQFDSSTGDYEFSNCRKGFTLTGRGTVRIRSCKIELVDGKRDRSVNALANSCTLVGTASVQVPSQGKTFSISDSNTANNTCACR